MDSTPSRLVGEAFLFSCFSPGIAVGLTGGSLSAGLFIAVIALIHAVFLGVPAYFLLRRIGWVNVISATAVGLVAACLPVGLLLFPGWSGPQDSSLWQGSVPLVINGASTAQGWHSYWETLAVFAAFGVVVGSLFWSYIRARSSRET
jgi:hypothetical protein